MEIGVNIQFWVPYPNMPPLQKGTVINIKDNYMKVISNVDNKEWDLNITYGLYKEINPPIKKLDKDENT